MFVNIMSHCAGNERLSERYKQDPKLSFVIKAIYTLAYGLHNLQQDVCGRDWVGICPQLFPINGSLFKNYLLNVSFTYGDGETVEFDRRGDPPGRYSLFRLKSQLSPRGYDDSPRVCSKACSVNKSYHQQNNGLSADNCFP
ncbi:Metabotropic glutamate receptor 1 [Homalodisca vitripennis]|nr:Metabotropic glutamate receptor 1 [Homalodisca vitripennis]